VAGTVERVGQKVPVHRVQHVDACAHETRQLEEADTGRRPKGSTFCRRSAPKLYVFGAGRFAPGQLFGLNVRVSKTIAAPAVVDSQAFGRLYASPISLASFEADAGTTNRTNVRMEGHAAFGTVRQAAAVRIAAS
jgi:hypothetical protein